MSCNGLELGNEVTHGNKATNKTRMVVAYRTLRQIVNQLWQYNYNCDQKPKIMGPASNGTKDTPTLTKTIGYRIGYHILSQISRKRWNVQSTRYVCCYETTVFGSCRSFCGEQSKCIRLCRPTNKNILSLLVGSDDGTRTNI